MLAISMLGLWYGRYPHQTITIVDPALAVAGSGGMEYSTFITAGTHALLGYWPFNAVNIPEEVTIHEFGHQFWRGSSPATTSSRKPGWTRASTRIQPGRSSRSATGAGGLRLVPRPRSARSTTSGCRTARIVRSTRFVSRLELRGRRRYGFNSYAKPELVRTLEGHLGERTMARVMRTCPERWRYGHPSSDDFYAVVNEVAGRDLRPAAPARRERRAARLRGSQHPQRARAPGGWLRGRARRREPSRARPRCRARRRGRPWASSFTVRRRGEIVLPPVTIAYKFEAVPPNGSSRTARRSGSAASRAPSGSSGSTSIRIGSSRSISTG